MDNDFFFAILKVLFIAVPPGVVGGILGFLNGRVGKPWWGTMGITFIMVGLFNILMAIAREW